MTEYDLLGYLILSIYFGFVMILGIMAFMLIYVQRIKKEMIKLKRDMYISIEKEVVELKMDILMVLESELVKLRNNMFSKFEKDLVQLKREIYTDVEKKLIKLKRDMSLGTEKELFKLNKNISDGITALVETVERVIPEKAGTIQAKSREEFTHRG
ncbi:MAG: hypothetical protein JSV50_01630 [Desulfobacteraceae bacterium]|nr:MAG: hypothetical protein JSV50_01630 [Desulfobacteraceae bacterium]